MHLRLVGLVLFLCLLDQLGFAQPATYTLHADAELSYVDLTLLDSAGEPIRLANLASTDFVLFDDGVRVPAEAVTIVDQQAELKVVYWLVVQCRMTGWDEQGSGFIRKHLDRVRRVLTRITADDRVGVAHWCDDGTSALDLMPTSDRGAPVATLQRILSKTYPKPEESREGELALQEMLFKLDAAEKAITSDTSVVPVVIVFHGDETGMPRRDYDGVEASLLATKEVCFVINDGRYEASQFSSDYLRRNLGHVMLNLSYASGGRLLIEKSSRYDQALLSIFEQVKGPTELAFRPLHSDHRLHSLKLTLTDSAKDRLPEVELHYRKAYMAGVAEKE